MIQEPVYHVETVDKDYSCKQDIDPTDCTVLVLCTMDSACNPRRLPCKQDVDHNRLHSVQWILPITIDFCHADPQLHSVRFPTGRSLEEIIGICHVDRGEARSCVCDTIPCLTGVHIFILPAPAYIIAHH